MATTKGRVQVDGGRRLRATMRKAGHDLGELREANATAGRIVGEAARPRSPRRTGRLAGTVRSSGTLTGAVIRAGYAAVPYAGPIHWGWPGHNIEAQPFISEAAQATEPRWILAYREQVDKIIDSIKGA